MKKLDTKKWEHSVSWKFEGYPFFASGYQKNGHLSGKSPYYEGWEDYLCFYENGFLVSFKPKNQFEKIGEQVIRELSAGKSRYLQSMLKIHDDLRWGINQCLLMRASGDYSRFERLWPRLQKIYSSTSIFFPFDFGFDQLMNRLELAKPKEHQALYDSLAGNKRSYMDDAALYAKDLSDKHPTDPEKVFKLFKRRFGWFQNSYKGRFVIDKDWFDGYLAKLQTNEPNKRTAPKKTKLPWKYQQIIRTAKEISIFRDDRKKFLQVLVEVMDPWLHEACAKRDWDYATYRWLTADEFIKLLHFQDRTLLRRAKSFSKKNMRRGIMSPTGYKDVTDSLWRAVLEINSAEKNTNVVKGMCANKGVCRGRAKIILKAEAEGRKLGPDDILVTSMTRPEFIPLMRIAKAFVTDEGGISCHAAIVARELGKPCIVGTKNGTQILKDGDWVEIDATKGTITVLKK